MERAKNLDVWVNTSVFSTFFLSLFLFSPFQSLSQFFPTSFKEAFKKIYLFLAALGLLCWAQAFSSCGEQGLPFIVVRELLIAVASLVVEHGL